MTGKILNPSPFIAPFLVISTVSSVDAMTFLSLGATMILISVVTTELSLQRAHLKALEACVWRHYDSPLVAAACHLHSYATRNTRVIVAKTENRILSVSNCTRYRNIFHCWPGKTPGNAIWATIDGQAFECFVGHRTSVSILCNDARLRWRDVDTPYSGNDLRYADEILLPTHGQCKAEVNVSQKLNSTLFIVVQSGAHEVIIGCNFC